MTSPIKTDETDIKNQISNKQILKKQITCSFELEKMETQTHVNHSHHINRTNSYIEKDQYIIDTAASSSIHPDLHQTNNINNNHLGHGGNCVNLNQNFSTNQFQLHRSDECENLTQDETTIDKNDKGISHLKRTIELENLVNNEINNDE
jgi:hypothetical protein